MHGGALAPGSYTDARVTITGGGAAANTAAWLAAAGVDVTLVGVVDEARALLGVPPHAPDPDARHLAVTFGGEMVLKRGAAGAVWSDGADVIAVPVRPAEAIDPTGAGDAFAAGYLAARLGGAAPAGALRAGAVQAATAVSRVGARPEPPDTAS